MLIGPTLCIHYWYYVNPISIDQRRCKQYQQQPLNRGCAIETVNLNRYSVRQRLVHNVQGPCTRQVQNRPAD